jgi:hypothetical protein
VALGCGSGCTIFNREEFLQQYPSVESTFSMIKAKLGDAARSHNICCLIQQAQELGISSAFWASKRA